MLFFGSVAVERVPELVGLTQRLATEAGAAYEVRADRGGGRDRGGDGVAWLGLSTGGDRLTQLAQLALDASPPDITPGRSPRRTPSAHLTLVRRADAAVIRDLRDATLGPLGVGWTVDRVQLIRSHLGRDRARYTTVHESAL